LPRITRKTADETVTSSTAFQDDDVLLQAILASQVWLCRWVLFCSVNATPGIKFAVTVPASATLLAIGQIQSPASTTVIASSATQTASGSSIIASTSAVFFAEIMAYVLNSTNAGNITLQWAQNVSNAASTTVLAGSTLTATRIA
jgi:hypothetical protein